MALSEWTSFGDAAVNHTLDDFEPGTGETSLLVKDSRTTSAEILTRSLDDEPLDGMVQTDVSIDGAESIAHVFFRFVDSENYYVTSYGYESEQVYLSRVRDGFPDVYERPAERPAVFEDRTFVPVRVRFWLDGTDDFRVSWEYRDGQEWTSLGHDLSLTESAQATGGGIGVGGQADVADWTSDQSSISSVRYDRTSIHYPQ